MQPHVRSARGSTTRQVLLAMRARPRKGKAKADPNLSLSDDLLQPSLEQSASFWGMTPLANSAKAGSLLHPSAHSSVQSFLQSLVQSLRPRSIRARLDEPQRKNRMRMGGAKRVGGWYTRALEFAHAGDARSPLAQHMWNHVVPKNPRMPVSRLCHADEHWQEAVTDRCRLPRGCGHRCAD